MTHIRRITTLALLLLLVPALVAGQDYDFSIKLQSREFTPSPVKTALPAAASALLDKHVYVQFDRPLTDADRADAAARGLELLEYIPNFAYRARLTQALEQADFDGMGIRWLDAIPASDKLSPWITEYGIGEWALRDGNKVELAVIIHEDEDVDEWADRLAGDFDAEIIGTVAMIGGIELILKEIDIDAVAQLDAVTFIEPAMPPQEIHNDNARENTGAEVLQAAPYGLRGDGIMIAEWDGGLADNTHIDLRFAFHGEQADVEWHATHVAGTVIGTGAESGGTYRGMAPGARLVSFQWWGSSFNLTNEMTSAIDGWGADISTNSWGLGVGDPASEASCEATMGSYPTVCGTLDDIIRGSLGTPITVCFSAGNQRGSSSKYCGSLGWTYGTVGPYATTKNIIAVGAINSNNNTMTSFSSWGPTDDGRVKPDVVGPGCQAGGDGGLTSCNLSSGYNSACGTSMSCPAVAGTTALLLQAFNSTFPDSTIIPSTVKALYVASAEDLGNFGVDYSFGHGKVDGVKAIDKLMTGSSSYVTADISTSEMHTYDITVPSGVPFKVALVWDDPGGVSGVSQHLINDLDLVLIDPFGVPHDPQVLDPANPSAAAVEGVDRTNNVETFLQDPPTPGLWTVEVHGFNIPDGPQTYSLAFEPNNIHTPGNTRALAVFNEALTEPNPSDTVDLDFWVSNVGESLDSMTITINDNLGWLTGTVDTVVSLNSLDSVYFQMTVIVPELALDDDIDSVVCFVQSLTDSNIVSYGTSILDVTAYFDLQLQAPFAEDTTWSPEILPFSVSVENQGNSVDQYTVTLSSSEGWPIAPASKIVVVEPMTSTSVDFTINIPAEVAHLTNNVITVDAVGNGGPSDQTTFSTIVNNPLMPPNLIGPAAQSFINDRTPTFDWSGQGDSYVLRISTDTSLATIRNSYALSDTTFSLPTADSLIDGEYYWGVRQFAGADSSSYQKSSRRFIIDNSPPYAVAPVSPIGDSIISQENFLFLYSPDLKSAQAISSPEFHRIQLARDSGFTVDARLFEPIAQLQYQQPDTLGDGRWYWRAQRADSAGNEAPYSSVQSFILDTETPEVPALLSPADGDTVESTPVVLKWTTGPPSQFEASAEYYFLQMSTHPQFFTIDYSNNVWADSIVLTTQDISNGSFYYWRVKSLDSASHQSDYQSVPGSFLLQSFICGNIDGSASSTPDIADLTFLVSFMFGGGPSPDPLIVGSVNCDATIDIADLTYLVAFMFGGGAAPCCN